MQKLIMITGENLSVLTMALAEGFLIKETLPNFNFSRSTLFILEKPDIKLKELSIESLKTPIDNLNFSVRLVNCLKNSNIETLDQLIVLKEENLMRLDNFGIKCMRELKFFLSSNNLGLGMKL